MLERIKVLCRDVPEYGDVVSANGRDFVLVEDPYDKDKGVLGCQAFELKGKELVIENACAKPVYLDIVTTVLTEAE